MADGPAALSEKEKQVLRLLLRGHDAKSSARALGRSVHTVNERLRDARRKLGVSSSREAARLLLAHEGDVPEKRGDTSFGDGSVGIGPQGAAGANDHRQWPARPAFLVGAFLMSLVLAFIAIATLPQTSAPGAAPTGAPAVTATATEAHDPAVDAARRWLALLDESRWAETYEGTGASFRALNTLAAWIAASERARVPLGAVRTRTLIAHDDVPAPPHGFDLVRFRTDFAGKAGVEETVTLDREDGAWRVVGITVG